MERTDKSHFEAFHAKRDPTNWRINDVKKSFVVSLDLTPVRHRDLCPGHFRNRDDRGKDGTDGEACNFSLDKGSGHGSSDLAQGEKTLHRRGYRCFQHGMEGVGKNLSGRKWIGENGIAQPCDA